MNLVHIARRAGLLLATVVTVLAPTAAHADDEIALSLDGVHWHASLATPLFDGSVQWVPGDVRTASFHVRNDGSDAGDLEIAVARTESYSLLDSGFLTVSARAGDGPWTPVDEMTPKSLVDGTEVASGADVPVLVRVTLAENAPNDTKLLASDFGFSVRLTDASATSPDGDHNDDFDGISDGDSAGHPDGDSDSDSDGDSEGGLGVLPDTGGDFPVWLPPLALLMLGTGTFLVLCRRTSRDDRSALSQS